MAHKERPKGGLGIRKTCVINQALNAKLTWRLIHEKDALWAKTIYAKYEFDDVDLVQSIGKKALASGELWKKGLTSISRKGTIWVPHDGQSIKVWQNNWLGNSSLRSLVQGPLPRDCDSVTISDLWTLSEGWNIRSLGMDLLDHIKNIIRVVPMQGYDHKPNQRDWVGNSSNGSFSCKSAYDIAFSSHLNMINSFEDFD